MGTTIVGQEIQPLRLLSLPFLIESDMCSLSTIWLIRYWLDLAILIQVLSLEIDTQLLIRIRSVPCSEAYCCVPAINEKLSIFTFIMFISMHCSQMLI